MRYIEQIYKIRQNDKSKITRDTFFFTFVQTNKHTLLTLCTEKKINYRKALL